MSFLSASTLSNLSVGIEPATCCTAAHVTRLVATATIRNKVNNKCFRNLIMANKALIHF